jgi:7,8-dihydro-6-hydroxymethylpterin-pyrophosphokinase
MDIDVIVFDDMPIMKLDYWDQAFIMVPLAELLPDFIHPVHRVKLSRFSGELQGGVWIVRRDDVVI